MFIFTLKNKQLKILFLIQLLMSSKIRRTKDNSFYMCDFFCKYTVALNYLFIFTVLVTIIKYINFKI